MKRTVFVFIYIFLSFNLYASFETVEVSPFTISNGNISGFHPGDSSVPYLNGGNTYINFSYLYPYGLKELTRQDISFKSNIFDRSFFLKLQYFGNEVYSESTVLLSAGLFSIADLCINPALSFYFLSTEIDDNFAGSFDLNSYYRFNHDMEGVFSIKNIYILKDEYIDIPLSIMVNLKYKITKNIDVLAGLEKDENTKANFKTGLKYSPIKYIDVSAGYNFEPKTVNTGFSINYLNYKFSYAVSYHFDLAYSHAAGFIYEI